MFASFDNVKYAKSVSKQLIAAIAQVPKFYSLLKPYTGSFHIKGLFSIVIPAGASKLL